MLQLNRKPFLRAMLLFVTLTILFIGCDSGGVSPPEDDPPENDSISVAVSAVDPDGAQIEAAGYLNDSKVSEDGTINTRLEEAEKDFSIRFESRGLITVDTTLSQSVGHEFDMVMREDNPDTVTKTLSATAAESDTAIAVDFYNDTADTLLAANVSEVSVQFPYQEQSVSVRAQREYFQPQRQSVSLSEDGAVPAFTLQRESVSIEVLLETMANEPDLSDATIKIYEPANKDSVSCTGRECRFTDLPKRSGQRSVQITNRDRHPETGNIRRYDPYTETFAADETKSLSAELEALAACNDGISNETGSGDDGLVDVWEDTNGNGIPDKGDIGDPGCRNPQDDNEGHRFLTRVTTQLNQDHLISSADGKAEDLIDDHSSVNPLPASAGDAIGDFILTQENLRTADDAGEAFYLRFNTGPEGELGNVNSTQTIPDADTIDGWHDAQVYGVDASFWGDENYYTITAVYDGPSDADADIRFLFEDGEGRKTVISYLYEEEDHEGSSNAKTSRQQAGTECRTNDGLKVCETVGFRSYLKP